MCCGGARQGPSKCKSRRHVACRRILSPCFSLVGFLFSLSPFLIAPRSFTLLHRLAPSAFFFPAFHYDYFVLVVHLSVRRLSLYSTVVVSRGSRFVLLFLPPPLVSHSTGTLRLTHTHSGGLPFTVRRGHRPPRPLLRAAHCPPHHHRPHRHHPCWPPRRQPPPPPSCALRPPARPSPSSRPPGFP